jgi:hypothetical protein
MPSEPLPSDVATFISDHLRSIDEIEVLTAIVDTPDRWWDARLVYSELGIAVGPARDGPVAACDDRPMWLYLMTPRRTA